MAAVYERVVIPGHRGDDNVDMSLRAAEKARRASEEFIQRVNELIPDDPKRYHKNILKGIDGKLALLKKNVAYLVLQNLTLIDKLMDAENTVHQVRNLHELRCTKDRPNTFAAPDSPPEKDFNTNSDRTKCESWCNPIIDFVIFNENPTDLQSRKLSVTNNFITNRLRQYIIREDMINYLEPHLASFLFPNDYKEKDSDNDSGTGEEIASPDEFETTNLNKFGELDSSAILSSVEKLEKDLGRISNIANGKFSISCSRGIVAEQSGDKIIGIVQSVELGGNSKENRETSIPEKSINLDDDDTSFLTDMSSRQFSTSLGEEFRRRGYNAIGDSLSDAKTQIGIQNDLKLKTVNKNEKSSTENIPIAEKPAEVKRTASRLSSIRGQFEKEDTKPPSFTRVQTSSDVSRCSSIRGQFEKDDARATSRGQTEKDNTRPSPIRAPVEKEDNKSSVIRGEFEKKADVSSFTNERTQQVSKPTTIVPPKESVAKTTPASEVVKKPSQYESVIVKQNSADQPKEEKPERPPVLHKATSLNFENEPSLFPNQNSRRFSQGQNHYGRTFSRQNSLGGESDFISFDRTRRDSISSVNSDFSDKRFNFSSKVNRGNRLRKSKRIEDTHRMFESNINKDTKQQRPDPTLRFASGISKNPWSENKAQSLDGDKSSSRK